MLTDRVRRASYSLSARPDPFLSHGLFYFPSADAIPFDLFFDLRTPIVCYTELRVTDHACDISYFVLGYF